MPNTKYIFGPVPSRRLGLSLGIDVIPYKICSIDCVYCQVGRTTEKTTERKEYMPVDELLTQLKQKLDAGVEADFITLSGSGEPTLNSKLAQIITGIKNLTDIPVAVLTNATLFSAPAVRADCALADVVLPSLDAADEPTFQKINRPHPDISIENVIAGLCAFRKEFTGQIWLEVFFVEGLNTAADKIAAIAEAITRINPDKVQLNTAVRPTAESGIKPIDPEKLAKIAKKLGKNAEIIADFSKAHPQKNIPSIAANSADILTMLKRRPCSLSDISAGLGLHLNQVQKHLADLLAKGKIESEQKNDTTFFKAK
ncbi:radical SAM protein [Planctomycetota bacterium]